MRHLRCLVLAIGAAILAVPSPGLAQQPAAWSEPAPPFRVTDGVFYVGTTGLASYLIVSGREAILLDATLNDNVPAIEANIRALGFELTDVKFIINSHAHFDHAAGTAALKKSTGAKVAIMSGDVSAMEKGRHEGDNVHGVGRMPTVKVDQVLADGDSVSVGDVRLTAVLTAGHSKGCTTWWGDLPDAGTTRRVVFPCSLTVAGNVLVGNKAYPGIVEDYRRSFDRLDGMQADIVLTAHPEFSDIFGRRDRGDAGDAEAFVDTGALKRLVDKARQAFDKDLAKARAK
ncbi:MAG: subclass B3 metallo-beta-lactamase [Rhizobiaceae bacterium]